VKLVLLDEISLVGCRALARLHNHICAIFPERAHLRFAGIIFFGDFDQMEPVFDEPLYADCSGCAEMRGEHCRRCAQRRESDGADLAAVGRALFRDGVTAFFELTRNYCSGADRTLRTALHAASQGIAPSAKTLRELNTRIMTASAAVQNAAPTALWTAPYRATVQELNIRALNRLTRASSTTVNVHAQHFAHVKQSIVSESVSSYEQRLQLLNVQVHLEAKSNANRDDFSSPLRATLTAAVGSRVALDRHIAPELGLCKGATGTLLGFVYDASEGDCSPSLSVEDAARAESQPPLPIAIVNMDERWYYCDSAGARLAALLAAIDVNEHKRVVPIPLIFEGAPRISSDRTVS